MAESNTHTAILEAAFSVFGSNPGASILDVAKLAGVGRATLYRHFASREALMIELAVIADRELSDAVKAATKDSKNYLEALEQAMGAMVPLADRQWFLALEPVQYEPTIAALYKSGMDEMRIAIKGARGEGAFAPDISDDWIIEVYDNLIYAAWMMVRKTSVSSQEAAHLAWRSFMNGMKGN